jgi:hypothetical protein
VRPVLFELGGFKLLLLRLKFTVLQLQLQFRICLVVGVYLALNIRTFHNFVSQIMEVQDDDGPNLPRKQRGQGMRFNKEGEEQEIKCGNSSFLFLRIMVFCFKKLLCHTFFLCFCKFHSALRAEHFLS